MGLIGTSIALRATALGWRVTGWDADPGHVHLARERGALEHAAGSLREAVADADVVVLAAPLDATLAQLAELAGEPPRAELVIDVASLQVPVSRAGATLETFVATHPIAGSERSGPAAGDPDLFGGRTWTYDAGARVDARARAVAFIAAMGARPLGIANDEHDRLVALTSHLPQLVSVALGVALAERIDDPHARDVCGTGMVSLLRLARSSWRMWEPVFALNAVSIAQEVRRMVGILSEAADALENGSPEALARDFDVAAAAVARLTSGP